MAICIEHDVKGFLLGMIDNMDKASLKAMVSAMPACAAVAAPAAAKEAAEHAKRQAPEAWGIKPLYYNEKGEETEHSSPSALVKSLGLPMSGIQCDIEGKKCRAQSAVEIMRIHGFTVSGDGEPKKASEGGSILKVYHPLAPQLKKE